MHFRFHSLLRKTRGFINSYRFYVPRVASILSNRPFRIQPQNPLHPSSPFHFHLPWRSFIGCLLRVRGEYPDEFFDELFPGCFYHIINVILSYPSKRITSESQFTTKRKREGGGPVATVFITLIIRPTFFISTPASNGFM